MPMPSVASSASRFAAGSALLLATLLVGAPTAGCQSTSEDAPSDAGAADTSDVYTQTTPSRDGTGKVYMGREISQVMGHRGAAWLERPERATKEKPELLVDSMRLAPDDVVADIGAGTGYFTFRIAPRVPQGRVFAVDIQPEMLDIVRSTMDEEGIDNVTPVRGTVTDPNLPSDSVDAALMVDAYHEFSHPREMMLNLKDALVPGGRVYLVEYRKEDPSIPIKPLHKMTEAQARKELEAVGFEWVTTQEMLPRQHVLVFTKTPGASQSE